MQVMARVGIVRKDFKDAATAIVPSAYSLPVGDKEATALAVEKLLENDRYIFPVPKGVCFVYLFSKATD